MNPAVVLTLTSSDLQDRKREREDIPENSVASLQEELAASKLREAESHLALKDLRSKVGELSAMWQKHLKVIHDWSRFYLNPLLTFDTMTAKDNIHFPLLQRAEAPSGQAEVPSTPKKLLGSLLEAGAKSEVTRLEEDLMSTRLKEVEAMGELKELRLKVRHLTQQKIFDISEKIFSACLKSFDFPFMKKNQSDKIYLLATGDGS